MKKVYLVLIIILLVVMAGCGGNKQSTDDYIVVDVTKSYPHKELILQDFMDVEYIPLETTDDFLTQGNVLAIGKEVIIAKNQVNDGDIFIFDRNGKGLRKINRKGQGPEEYISILGIALDEDINEMFINDHMAKKIFVYDLDGNFKRSFRHKEGASYYRIYNYDTDHLICHEVYHQLDENDPGMNSFFIVSKQDGSLKEVEIPFIKKISTMLGQQNAEGIFIGAAGPSNCRIVPFQSNWILTEPSSDTVYRYLPDDRLLPFIVRTPSVQSMNPEVFLFPGVITDRYYFVQTVKKEYDFEKLTGLPRTDLMYDTQEKSIFKCTVYNGDFTSERSVPMFLDAVSDEIAFRLRLEAYQLVEDYKKGELKEIAAKLDAEDNPVIMLVKHKR